MSPRVLVARAQRAQLRADRCPASRRAPPASSSTHSTGSIAPSRRTPTSAVRKTAGWVLKTPSQGIVKQRALRRDDAVRLAAAEPEAAALVEVADVAHAVVEAARAGSWILASAVASGRLK